MSAPHLDGGIYTDAGTQAVRISWSQGTGRGARLPESYFAQVFSIGSQVSPEYGDDDLIDSVKFMPPRTVIVYFSSAFVARIKSKPSVTFVVMFPDRRTSISCHHHGMSDRYYLKVDMAFDDRGRLTSSNLIEVAALGPI
jgi:hypothetical protein